MFLFYFILFYFVDLNQQSLGRGQGWARLGQVGVFSLFLIFQQDPE
jgi:hypothetical protein